jgi:signal transduction histidine kinase
MSEQDNGVEALRKEIRLAKEELEIQQWGIAKTNEAIKTLYKELEKKNEELQRLGDLKSSFVYGLTHELRTPLAMIKEGVAQLAEGIVKPLPPKRAQLLSIILDNIDRLRRIIDNMLDMAKLEAGKAELNLEKTDLVVLAKRAVAAFKVLADKKNIEIRESFSGINIMACVDKDKMVQVFTNLIGNALKFTPKGHIEVGVCGKGGDVECYIADTGIGIPKEFIGKVFERFQQFPHSLVVAQKGTGLGLSIVKDIITLHGGTISVESEPDKGTKFTFTIPCAIDEKKC